tara:strand:+ start:1085 stop:1372 length:288 start_codon:yes stop_codon:yes gene_type:complete
MNAKKELLEEIEGKEVEYVKIGKYIDYDELEIIEGSLEEVLPRLDYDYDSGYGGQRLFGFIWYKDGSWSERGEYDGSEWWTHKTPPSKDVELTYY